jgi:hypothetical protein
LPVSATHCPAMSNFAQRCVALPSDA